MHGIYRHHDGTGPKTYCLAFLFRLAPVRTTLSMRVFQKSYLKKTTEVNGDPKNGRFVVYADCLPMTLRGMKW